MILKCTTLSLAMFLGAILLPANGLTAAVTKLNGIRAWQHKGYTRLVLDAGDARPLKIGPVTAEGVIIVYEQLELMRTPSVLFRNLIGAAASANHHRQADRSVITIRFKDPDTTVRSFYLEGKSAEKGAYRLIMDLYPPGNAAAGPGTLVPAASAKTENPAPTPAPAPAAAPPRAAAEVSETRLPAAPSSQQIEEILPKAPEKESASQTVRIETTTGKQKQEVQPAEPPPKVRSKSINENLLNTPPSEKASRADVTEQLPNRNEFRGGKDKRKEPGTVGQQRPLRVKKRTMSFSPAVEENVMQRQAVSHERKGPIYNQKSIGLVELTLKLMSIALSCLVILFLHRANKIATNRYDALKHQHGLDTGQNR